MGNDFVRKQAEAYRDAKVSLAPWQSYAKEVVEQWREIDHPIQLVESAMSYIDPLELRRDIAKGRPIKVWEGGIFSANHPLIDLQPIRIHTGRLRDHHWTSVYCVSRVLHDYNVHYRMRLSFSPLDELHGAIASRHDFSQSAQIAQWTDDVAMGCYYAHFGKWPEVQRPVTVNPDWEGLREFLAGS